jgi:hypothetical protein
MSVVWLRKMKSIENILKEDEWIIKCLYTENTEMSEMKAKFSLILPKWRNQSMYSKIKERNKKLI